MSDFDRAFEEVVGIEGGYVNDPQDPGGETKYGITKVTLQMAIADGILPAGATIKGLTPDQAKAVYKHYYWDRVKGDQLPYPTNMFVFDAAVNQGVDPAIKLLQKTLNVPQDGILGVTTMKAAQEMRKDAQALYLADRALRYVGTRNFDRFGRGWLKRLFVVAMGD